MRICTRMETLVSNSDLDWTIVRPAGLFDTRPCTHYQVAQAYMVLRERKLQGRSGGLHAPTTHY